MDSKQRQEQRIMPCAYSGRDKREPSTWSNPGRGDSYACIFDNTSHHGAKSPGKEKTVKNTGS
jgi:hypothetical protein